MGSADGFSEYIQSNPAIETKFYRTCSAATLYPEIKRVLVADGRNLRTHLCDMCTVSDSHLDCDGQFYHCYIMCIARIKRFWYTQPFTKQGRIQRSVMGGGG